MDEGSVSLSYWSRTPAELMVQLGTRPSGLSTAEAAQALERFGHNTLAPAAPGFRILRLFLGRFRSPLVLVLVFAAGIALVLHDWLDATIILLIVLASALLSFFQEHRATQAVERLKARVAIRATVLRDGSPASVPADEVVPGDVVMLSAGSLVPADAVLFDARDLFVAEAVLTGETFPVEKRPGTAPADAGLAAQANCVFMGTSVRSGKGSALVVRTGMRTRYGGLAATLARRAPETEFERGLRQFGMLLMRMILVIVLAVFACNVVLRHPTLEMLLFAMALAVGLSPELLPAILTITLAQGARQMATVGVIVKRLNAIENLGSMDVLCCDKTGTLTRGVVQLDAALDFNGEARPDVLGLAFLNAALQTGIDNPLDQAIVAAGQAAGLAAPASAKLDEVPYDFLRKRLSVLVETGGDAGDGGHPGARLITKGALENVLAICDRFAVPGGTAALGPEQLASIRQRQLDWGSRGIRVLGLAYKDLPDRRSVGAADEAGMVFAGYLLFFDPPEPEVRRTLGRLRRLGVRVKIITGDNRDVARHVAEAAGIPARRVITGAELVHMKDEALWHLAPRTHLFAEADPNQKERIIRALQKSGHVVGFLGDGINDAPALHAADVSISVDRAMDVAKEAADFVLLEHDLAVLGRGIDVGHHTFANTIKYVYITTSANFGNMISMALASLFLPFLPLLAKQILLNNLLSDIPAVGIASDNVDRDWEKTPHRWDMRMVRNFMIIFGLASTVFDLLTFGALLYLAGAVAEIFRTGWFIESLLTELLVVFVIRTHKPIWQSRAGRLLSWSTLAVLVLTFLLPYLPFAAPFGLVPLPFTVIVAILVIALAYLGVLEAMKRTFFTHRKERRARDMPAH